MKNKCLFIFLFMLVLVCCIASASGAEVDLLNGTEILGSVNSKIINGETWVSVIDVGSLFSLQNERYGEELVFSDGRSRLKIVQNAAAAWYNSQLIPLYDIPYVDNSIWWLDVRSVSILFQKFAGSKKNDNISFSVDNENTVKRMPSEKKREVILLDVPVIHETVPIRQNTVSNEKTLIAQTAVASAVNEVRWSSSDNKVRSVIEFSGEKPEIHQNSNSIQVKFTKNTSIGTWNSKFPDRVNLAIKNKVIEYSGSWRKADILFLDSPSRVVIDFVFEEKASELAKTPREQPSQVKTQNTRKSSKLLVVLDPGHGGKDSGAVANGLLEKTINLAIATKMESELKSHGINVVLTRRTDVYLKLQERTDIANNADADLFVSVHVNALPKGKKSSGFEIYIMAMPTDKDALELAKFENRELVDGKTNAAAADKKTQLLLGILGDMQQNSKIIESTQVAEVLYKAGDSGGLPMKRVAQAPFFVLRGAGMPAVLLETGFLTDSREAKLLAHPLYQQKIADAMTDGIINYLGGL